MSPDEQSERQRLAATPGLPGFTQRVIQHHTTPIDVARRLAAQAAPNPVAATSAAQREAAERAERLDREMRITGGPVASFDSKRQVQTFGARSGEAAAESAEQDIVQTFGEAGKGGE